MSWSLLLTNQNGSQRVSLCPKSTLVFKTASTLSGPGGPCLSLPTLPMAPGPMPAPTGPQSLAQRHHSQAGPHPHGPALPGHGPGPPADILTCPHPHGPALPGHGPGPPADILTCPHPHSPALCGHGPGPRANVLTCPHPLPSRPGSAPEPGSSHWAWSFETQF